MWRVSTWDVFRPIFRKPNREPFSTFVDWTAPYLDLDAMARNLSDVGQMVMYETEASAMPRDWLRWAVTFAQKAARVEQSGPRDGQLAAYLPDADVFLTNDRRFARILQPVISAAPVPLAEIRYAGLSSATDSICDALEALLTCGRAGA